MEKAIGKSKSMRFVGALACAVAAAILAIACLGVAPAHASAGVEMQRLYNPNSGEHFYTASIVERDHLVSVGWSHEGVGWTAPESSGTPVHRLYNANAGDHHYTTSDAERAHLESVGWSYEGIGWYSDDAKGVALFRQYNPNAMAGSHNYTTSAAERDHLVSVGWNDEGVAWYGIDSTAGAQTDGQPDPPQQPGQQEPAGSGDANEPTRPTAPGQQEPEACRHQWEDVYRTESYVVSEAYDYQKQVYVADQWQCQCLELFDTLDGLHEHQDYHYDNGTIEGHGRSRVVPVYEYETVHVPEVMGEREVLLYTECTKCGYRF